MIGSCSSYDASDEIHHTYYLIFATFNLPVIWKQQIHHDRILLQQHFLYKVCKYVKATNSILMKEQGGLLATELGAWRSNNQIPRSPRTRSWINFLSQSATPWKACSGRFSKGSFHGSFFARSYVAPWIALLFGPQGLFEVSALYAAFSCKTKI